ncbi:MAG: hypothetical protein KAU20_04930 [Nanoarchaeota archaeon]|nr:hypothetical protein [Nanoarchaeota archaeon]
MKLNKKELLRGILHIIAGITIIFLIRLGILTPISILGIVIFGLILSFLSRKHDIPVICWFLNKLERKENMKVFPGKGPIFFFTGVLLTLRLFPMDIALASIMILTFADPVSNFIGKNFGRIKNPINGKNGKKQLEGNIAGAFVGFLAAMFFVNPLYAALASSGAMVAEAIELKMNRQQVDDNIVVPLVAGTIMVLLKYYNIG